VTGEQDPEARVLETLDALGVAYEVIPIDPAFADTAAFCEHYGYPLDQSANTLVVATRKEPKRFAVCVVLATTTLDVNRAVRRHLGVKKLSFASVDDMARLTGMLVGGVTPFCIPDGVPVLVDARVMECPWILLGTGGRDSKIKTTPEVFARLPTAQVVTDLAKPRSA
jgi:prolyl-tRNA editing enzyme YbaK/EbsC (Cys-tRNA(Pro) deacylase)